VYHELTEVVSVVDWGLIPLYVVDPLCQHCGVSNAVFGEVDQSVWAERGDMYRRTERNPRLIRTDVGGRPLLADVLFAGLECERVGSPVVDITADTDESTGYLPEEPITGRKDSESHSVAGRQTEHIGLADDHVSTDAGRLFKQRERDEIRAETEQRLGVGGELATDTEALFCLGSDLVALSLLEEPASVGADVVVGEADVLGLPTSYGMGLGIFATSDRFLRQVPGRLVGVGSDVDDRRAYTLTLQTREQHIRKERATSNICTNQAWVALRAAIHIASLGPDGLVDLAEDCVRDAAVLAERVDDIEGYQAPIHDRYHFREFVIHTDQPAAAITADVEAEGYAIHAIDDHLIQICLTETTTHATDGLVDALQEAA